MDTKLPCTHGQAAKDDDVESMWKGKLSIILKYSIIPQSKLATSRNANDESEVDESLLNVGLFTYPILQAADILAYK